MFERFTDRARRIVVLAQEEARLMNHNYIGTEHLLLAMLHEGEGIAARVLLDGGLTLEFAREQLEDIIGRGQMPPGGHIPFTPRSKKVLEFSLRESLELSVNFIGTEHVLLGLIREGEGVGAQIMLRRPWALDQYRARVLDYIQEYQTADPQHSSQASAATAIEIDSAVRPGLVLEGSTDRAQRVIALAKEEASLLYHRQIGPEHLLLGLIREGEGVAAVALATLGVSLESARQQVEEFVRRGVSPDPAALEFNRAMRAVLVMAQYEMGRLGHGYIGTEHLLLGILSESSNRAAQILSALGAAPDRVRETVLQLLGSPAVADPSQTQPQQTREAPGGLFSRMDALSRRMVVFAQEEARRLNHNYIGTEHFLLGFLDVPERQLTSLIIDCGGDPGRIRTMVEETIGRGLQPVSGHIPFTPRAKKILEFSLRESLQLGHNFVGAQHLLLGMIREEEGVAGQVLMREGVTLSRVRELIRQSLLLSRAIQHDTVGYPDVVTESNRATQTSSTQADPHDVDLQAAAAGLRLLSADGVVVLLALLADLVRLTGGIEPHETRLRQLSGHIGISRLRLLAWPPAARVGLAALLASQAPVSTSIDQAAVDALIAAADTVTDQTITMLQILGPATVAANPALPLKVRHRVGSLPRISVPTQRLLAECVVATDSHSRSHLTRTQGTAPGVSGVSRHGNLTHLLPTQLALPPDLFALRYANGELLYRISETPLEAPPQTVTMILDNTPPTFGPVEVVLRLVAHVIAATLWAVHRVPSLVTLDQPGLVRSIAAPADLVALWTTRTLEPPAVLEAALTAARRLDNPVLLLTHHHVVRELAVVPGAALRVLTTHVPGDAPSGVGASRFHVHLDPDPTAAQITNAARQLLQWTAERQDQTAA